MVNLYNLLCSLCFLCCPKPQQYMNSKNCTKAIIYRLVTKDNVRKWSFLQTRVVTLGPVVLEKSMRMWKVNRQTHGQQSIRRDHLNFKLRWFKIPTHVYFMILWKKSTTPDNRWRQYSYPRSLYTAGEKHWKPERPTPFLRETNMQGPIQWQNVSRGNQNSPGISQEKIRTGPENPMQNRIWKRLPAL